MTLPSELPIYAEVAVGDWDAPFIVAIQGPVQADDFVGMEGYLKDDAPDWPDGYGIYLVEWAYEDGQFDDLGRCEARSGWYCTVIRFVGPHPEEAPSVAMDDDDDDGGVW
jgi:hypothetical protein